MQIFKNRRDTVIFASVYQNASSGILYKLEFLELLSSYSIKQSISIV